jgi:alcohol dehydrogenase class IV
VGLPPRPTAGTGIDALTHAIESLTSKGSTVVSAAYAHQAIKLISKSLPVAFKDGKNIDARGDMLMGAHLAGLALTLSGLGLVHGVAHSVSATVGTAHGEALATVLPEVMQFNSQVSDDVYASIGYDMGVSANSATVIEAVRDLSDEIQIRNKLSHYGVTSDLVQSISKKVLEDSVTSNNPIDPTEDQVAGIIRSRL